MKRSQLLAAISFLLWAMPTFGGPHGECGGSSDCDGVPDTQDNCAVDQNPAQDDTDGDLCGNACDADCNQSGLVTVADFGEFAQNFGTGNQEFCHVGTIPGCTVGVDDFGFFAANFNTVPGPSGTTPGTTACP